MSEFEQPLTQQDFDRLTRGGYAARPDGGTWELESTLIGNEVELQEASRVLVMTSNTERREPDRSSHGGSE